MKDYKSIKQKRNIRIFIAAILFFAVCLCPIIFYKSIDIVLAINSIHNPIIDYLAHFLTFLGSLWAYILFLITLFFIGKSFKNLLFAGFSFFNTCIIVQILKHFIFETKIRPIGNIEWENIHILSSLTEDHSNSFPSGHASTAFVMANVIFFIFLRKNVYIYLSTLYLASFIAICRVYLCLHYYHDVYVGAIIGTICTYITYIVINKLYWPIWTDKSFFEQIKQMINSLKE